jgi:Fic family protein
MLLRAWSASEFRPTRDIDMLGMTSNDAERLESQMREILATPVEDDGLTFPADALRYEQIVASGLVHYELEFIHPFADGNGRMGRLWQTLALSKWKPVLAWLPVETVIRNRQADYCEVLNKCDRAGDATLFVEFTLQSLLSAIVDISPTDQVADQLTDQVKSLLTALSKGEASGAELMKLLGLSHKPTFRQNYLAPALDNGWVERSHPEAPRNPRKRYRLTGKGAAIPGPIFRKMKR